MFLKNSGQFWRADEVDWFPGTGRPGAFRLLGRIGENRPGIRLADFRFQQGIYILYGNHGPYYIGLTTQQGLRKRLKDHITDQHGERWDRFSWFRFKKVLPGKDELGISRVKEELATIATGEPAAMIRDIESLLIRAMGLTNIQQTQFAEAEEWQQVKLHEYDKYLSRVSS